MDVLRNMQVQMEELMNELNAIQKEMGKEMNAVQNLQAQLTENQLVKSELDLLAADTNVFKLVGPILVKQDCVEAQSNVNKRIEFIEAEMQKATDKLQRLEKTQGEKRVKVSDLQKNMQRIAMSMQQAAGAASAS
ncbi:Prefoldin subunit 6 [Porphyridium purpureum]|uniref:Prefoldin subunit 6 n=1 Tax=Porphyridium purpureum TaxID=35688 RepID=A0A5J4Z333_PORPP|nr:Prefoldin subunit 6 [Porphyridium purpureum]|eukprot:POR3772..scf208_2